MGALCRHRPCLHMCALLFVEELPASARLSFGTRQPELANPPQQNGESIPSFHSSHSLQGAEQRDGAIDKVKERGAHRGVLLEQQQYGLISC